MKKAQVIGPWNQDTAGAEPVNRPQITLDYDLHSFIDVTGQPSENIPTDPNMSVFWIVCDAATLAAIDADADYHILHSDDRPESNIPGAAEFGLLRAYLARAGVSQATIRSWIGTGAQGRTRAEIAAIMRERLRDLPKAE